MCLSRARDAALPLSTLIITTSPPLNPTSLMSPSPSPLRSIGLVRFIDIRRKRGF